MVKIGGILFMAKKFATILLAFVAVLGLCVPAYATAGGFFETGGYTLTDPVSYIFETDEAVLVYNGQVDTSPDYTEIWTGSVLYVPIYMDNVDAGTYGIATAKKIKDDKVDVQYKATVGARYVKNVSVVDGKKDKIKNLPAGVYAKIEFADSYDATSYTSIQMMLVLSVNNVSYQESRVMLECDFSNRLEFIGENSVYGAMVPTRFKVEQWYDGEATFDMGKGVKYTARVKKSARYTIDFTREPDYDIEYMYPDAKLQFYNFRGNNDTFESVGKLVTPVDTNVFEDPDSGQPRVYAYEVLASNQLKALGSESASYDSRKKELAINTKTLNHYVLSNVKLKQAVEEEQDSTFQSGYASDVQEASSEAAAQSTASGNARAASAAPQQTAQSQAADAADAPSTGNVTDLDSPNTGGSMIRNGVLMINADNRRGENPFTGAVSPAPSMAVLGLVAGAALWTWARRK